jgi:hypothetical protein
MATRSEHPEKYGWWLNELESLGVSTKRMNEFNDLKEISTLTENIKHAFYMDYKLESYNRYDNIIQHERFNMNISETETPVRIVAKTCDSKETKKRKVTYAFVDSYHGLCLDKKDIMYAELEACDRLLKYAVDESDKKTIESEIAELKMALDLLT